MTDRKELETLQTNARKAGRIVNFLLSKDGFIDSIFYLDSEGRGREKSGMVINPLTFAEKERFKQAPKHEKRRSFCG